VPVAAIRVACSIAAPVAVPASAVIALDHDVRAVVVAVSGQGGCGGHDAFLSLVRTSSEWEPNQLGRVLLSSGPPNQSHPVRP
jgi:hypothetical protein